MSPTQKARAVLYLRVSSRGQLETDFDDDGLSIAGQRAQCERKACDLGAVVVDEYIERAESAKSDDRPALQQMLARIRRERDVDFVILWKVDRFARNRRDDANMLFEIEMTGATLVSATENIDKTPAGRLMHAMLAGFAEYYSQNLAAEVVKGATQKAKRGGTPGIAPLGYLNVIQRIDGRDIRTVELDPERAPLIRWAFETYATGYYSLNDMVTLLEAKGLRSRGNRRYGPRPLNHATVYVVLSNDYYTGVVTYGEQKHPGRHKELVGRELFDQVQTVLRAHGRSGERDRKHAHYLKGTVFCGECGLRLTYSENTGNGGTYAYFVCPSRQRKQCSQRFHRVDRVEEAIERYYATVDMPEEDRLRVRQAVQERLAEMAAVSEKELTRCSQVLGQLEEQERKLLRAYYSDRVSPELFDEEQARIKREREQAEGIVARLSVQFDDIERTLDLALTLVTDVSDGYRRAHPHVRRLLNQALFEGIDISEEDVDGARLAQPLPTS
jgi:site-specific DNA recombinase